jgi:hypothetical protein
MGSVEDKTQRRTLNMATLIIAIGAVIGTLVIAVQDLKAKKYLR